VDIYQQQCNLNFMMHLGEEVEGLDDWFFKYLMWLKVWKRRE
jgi:hypothetical protein